ncbi:MAG: hypothetical protein M3R70_03025 [Actinomycetota bacterium]|nr:hypothetical protein [Actinomycetota bacterium]
MQVEHERIAKTESLFRDVNERIAEATERFDESSAQFMCECADPECAERIEVPLAEYEKVRSDGTTFVLDAEHLEPEVERVVEKRRGYAIVKKLGAVGQMVKRLNPRTEPA